MICPNCKNEIPNESIFCGECGARLLVVENNSQKNPKFIKLRNILKKKRVFIPILVICGLLIIAGITYAVIKPPSTKDVYNKIKDYKAEDISSYIKKVYPIDGGFLGLFKKENEKNRGTVLALALKDIEDNFKKDTGKSISDYSAVKITSVKIDSKSYSSGYVDVNITVNNGGKTPVRYVKVNLYYKNASGSIVKSEWTNDSSDIQPNASQTLTEMTKSDGWETVSAEIAEIR